MFKNIIILILGFLLCSLLYQDKNNNRFKVGKLVNCPRLSLLEESYDKTGMKLLLLSLPNTIDYEVKGV